MYRMCPDVQGPMKGLEGFYIKEIFIHTHTHTHTLLVTCLSVKCMYFLPFWLGDFFGLVLVFFVFWVLPF
jgi:uncharacterized membrane protein YjjP (DUF1212 family)